MHRGLAAVLRCPACHRALQVANGRLACADGHAYPIVDGIPVFMSEAALADEPHYASQRAYFDAEFARYDAYRLEPWRRSYLDRLRAAKALGGPGRPLVDVAVGGSGYTVIEAARGGRPAVGCDLSFEALRAARRFAHAEGVAERTLFLCCSAESLPLADGAFDVALAIAVLEHLPSDRAALAEIARVLAPGGRAWVTVPHALRHARRAFRLPSQIHDRRLGHLRRYEAEDVVAAGAAVDLTVHDVLFTGHSVKVAQIAVTPLLPRRAAERFWWWCERHDLAARDDPRGAMQLSVAFERT